MLPMSALFRASSDRATEPAALLVRWKTVGVACQRALVVWVLTASVLEAHAGEKEQLVPGGEKTLEKGTSPLAVRGRGELCRTVVRTIREQQISKEPYKDAQGNEEIRAVRRFVDRPVYEHVSQRLLPDPLDQLPAPQVAELVKALDDSEQLVRWAALFALSQVDQPGNQGIVESLRGHDEDPVKVASYIRDGLASIIPVDSRWIPPDFMVAVRALAAERPLVRWAGLIVLEHYASQELEGRAAAVYDSPNIDPSAVPIESSVPTEDLVAEEPQLSVKTTGPARQDVGKPVSFTIELTNTGKTPVTNVMVVDHYDTCFRPQRATAGYTWNELTAEIRWAIDRLAPNKSLTFQVSCICLEPSANSCNRVTVTSEEGADAEAEAFVDVQAPNGLAMIVAEEPDPVAVENQTIYQVRLTNFSKTEDENVRVTITLPDGLIVLPVGTRGPTKYVFDGQLVTFKPVAKLASNETHCYFVAARAERAGQFQCHVEVTSRNLVKPIVVVESTTVDFPGGLQQEAQPVRPLIRPIPKALLTNGNDPAKSKISRRDGVQRILEILANREEDPLVHKAAVYAIGAFGADAKEGLPQLVIALGDDDLLARRWAAFALGEIGPDAVAALPELIKLLADEPCVCPATAYAVGCILAGHEGDNRREVVRALTELLKSSDPSVRWWSADAFLKLNSRN